MVSKKPKVQSYVSPETYKRIEYLASGESISKTVEQILDEATQDNAIVIVLNDGQMRELRRLAAENYRPLKNQATMVVIEWLKSQSSE